jgi:hypothetical protein
MNRLNRDQVLTRALDMVDSPTLNAKERPSGSILPSAMCIGWLQEGLDYFHTNWPFGSTIQTTTITWVAGQEAYDLPDEFVQDYQDGLVHAEDQGRLVRKGLSALLDLQASVSGAEGKPAIYAVVGSQFRVRPVPSSQWAGKTATLYFYGLPAVLTASQKPSFPSDLILVRYVYLRGLEWTRSVPPGTAEEYAGKIIGRLQKNGIGNEAESTQVPFDRTQFPGSAVGSDPNSWMGSPVVTG